MDINLTAFQEPRGVMRIFQFVFAICAFGTTTSYEGTVDFMCNGNSVGNMSYDYPFRLAKKFTYSNCSGASPEVKILGDFSSDSQFFVCTGVLAMLYCIAIAYVYVKLDDRYKSNPQWPLADFALTVTMAVFWISGSGAWANGLSGLKSVIHQPIQGCPTCSIYASNFGSLNISVIFGFLNFFLWASDLWFIYKETEWFQQKQQAPITSPAI